MALFCINKVALGLWGFSHRLRIDYLICIFDEVDRSDVDGEGFSIILCGQVMLRVSVGCELAGFQLRSVAFPAPIAAFPARDSYLMPCRGVRAGCAPMPTGVGSGLP